MNQQKTTIAVAIGALLLGGVATAAYLGNRAPAQADAFVTPTDLARPASLAADDHPLDDNRIPAAGGLEYADVVAVKPVTERSPQYATVLGTDPIRETTTASTPREVCEDVAVQERLPERDGNVGGTVAGALIGGLVGNQVGKGDGRKLATVAGAVGGGFAGHEIDKRHVGGKVVTRTERQCHTVSDTSSKSRTVAWNVTYRNPDGSTGTMRTDRKPGSRIPLGDRTDVVGYDVTYRYRGTEQHLRMDDKPGDRLPIVDGQVVTSVATAGGTSRG